MRFGPIPLGEAEGAILAHSLTLAGGVVKKGTRLTAAHVARLAADGRTSVIGAVLEAGDVGEDEAAARVARVVAGSGVRVGEAFTGRANLFAEAAGLVAVDTARLLALNRLDEGLTVATLKPFERVDAGEMLATIKIITFAVPEAVVAAATDLAAGACVALHPFTARSAALVLTELAGTKPSVLRKRQRVMAARLEGAGSRLAAIETVPHEELAVAGAITRMAAAGHDPILVFATSAIVDRGDVIPAAVLAAGGRVVHLGMPVDPGNLLMLGRLGETDVIGVPSCAGSPKLNGFDWVLERRLAGLHVGPDEITEMSVGGLLKEIASRPQPRAGDGGEA